MTCCGMNLTLNELERVTLMKGHVERVQAESAYAPVHYKGSVQEDAQVRLGSVQNVNVLLLCHWISDATLLTNKIQQKQKKAYAIQPQSIHRLQNFSDVRRLSKPLVLTRNDQHVACDERRAACYIH